MNKHLLIFSSLFATFLLTMKSVSGETENEVRSVLEGTAALSLEPPKVNWPSDKELYKDKEFLSIAEKERDT